MSINYYIIGSGGFSKEVFFYTQKTLGNGYKFGGYIDNNIALKSGLLIEESSFLDTIKPSDEVVLFNGIGNPEVIGKIHGKFKEYNFPNLIYPGVLADFSTLKIGFGNIITPNCILTVDVTIGDFNIINLSSTIGHDTQIGNYNVINPGCNISGSVLIGDSNLLGTNCTILQGVSIGNYNKIGASSMVNKPIVDHQTMVGIPAKPLLK
jgi:sugar O-acyltransferase (sialic acid O-acetyltransferase NeuD family)